MSNGKSKDVLDWMSRITKSMLNLSAWESVFKTKFITGSILFEKWGINSIEEGCVLVVQKSPKMWLVRDWFFQPSGCNNRLHTFPLPSEKVNQIFSRGSEQLSVGGSSSFQRKVNTSVTSCGHRKKLPLSF